MLQRDVFYIAGYDPRSCRYYYKLLKKNLNQQNKINHLDLKLSALCFEETLQGKKNAFCKIVSKHSVSNYYFLDWSDLVQKCWSKSLWDFICDFIYFLRAYIFSGIVKVFIQKSKTQLLAGLYPIVYFISSYAMVFFSAYILWDFLEKWNVYLATLVALFYLWVATRVILWGGKRLAVFWLSNIYVFCAKYALGEVEGVERLLEGFLGQIMQSLKSNKDEVILCAHSVGTIFAVSVAARVIEQCKKERLSWEKLKILTLGQCIPLVSFQKQCEKFKEELAILGDSKVVWFDYTSKIDGACFPLLDFFRDSGVACKNPPCYLSPRFHKLFLPKTYAKIRYNWYLAHFLYLYATEISGEYDYFNFVGGPKILEQKIKGGR